MYILFTKGVKQNQYNFGPAPERSSLIAMLGGDPGEHVLKLAANNMENVQHAGRNRIAPHLLNGKIFHKIWPQSNGMATSQKTPAGKDRFLIRMLVLTAALMY